MRGRGSSNHCVSVSVCVYLCVCYHSSERYEGFKSQSKVPTESTRCREQSNVGIELQILGSKFMTVISSSWNYGRKWRQQVTSAVRTRLLVRQVLRLPHKRPICIS